MYYETPILYRVDSEEDDDTEGVLLAKGVCMLVLFVACMVCGVIPLMLAKRFAWLFAGDAKNLRSTNKIVMSLLSFGGGVLLATTFMHLIPEIEENIEELQEDGDLGTYEFSLAHLLTCSGFFIMYMVEEAIHVYIRNRDEKKRQASQLERNMSIRESPQAKPADEEKCASGSTTDVGAPKLEVVELHPYHTHNHHIPDEIEDTVSATLRGLLIVLALSIHELFEGLAVGLESSSARVWYMLGAIAGHKLVIAFCISVELIAARTKFWLTMVYVIVYAIISPVGIGIGMLLVGGQGAAAAGLPSVVLQGLACGTLLYVVFFEIWKGERTSIVQFIGSLIGFFFMFGLTLLSPHSHSHDHDHCQESFVD